MTTSTLRERTAFRSSSSPGRRSLAPDATSVNSITVQPRALAKARRGTSWLSVFWSVVETRPYNPAFAPAPKGLAVGPPVAVGLRSAKDGAGIWLPRLAGFGPPRSPSRAFLPGDQDPVAERALAQEVAEAQDDQRFLPVSRHDEAKVGAQPPVEPAEPSGARLDLEGPGADDQIAAPAGRSAGERNPAALEAVRDRHRPDLGLGPIALPPRPGSAGHDVAAAPIQSSHTTARAPLNRHPCGGPGCNQWRS